MKVAVTNGETPQKRELILPLAEDPDLCALDKTNSVSWELHTDPANNAAPVYKMQCRILQGNESCRQILRWKNDVVKVCIGLNANTYATIRPIITACMRTGPLATFNASVALSQKARYEEELAIAQATDRANGNTVAADAVRANGQGHYTHIDQLWIALNTVVSTLLPSKVVARVKRSLRREMRKPNDMKVRTYFQNLSRINGEELPGTTFPSSLSGQSNLVD